jgi:hypothetical protein
MSTVTDNELKRLEDLIINRFDKVDREIAELKKSQEILQTDFATIKGKLSLMEPAFQKLPDLAERVGELKNSNKIAIGGISALIGGFLGFFLRGH